ncbi:MAG: endonuclease/exonuclease/phosphatase family protein [Parashewanella sp.]
MKLILYTATLITALCSSSGCAIKDENTVNKSPIRFATFNVAFDRASSHVLAEQMAAGNNRQIKNVAEIIQRTQADVLLLNEFDHDGIGRNTQVVTDFQQNFLTKSQNGAPIIHYPYFYIAPTNTGLAEHDLNGDGKISLPADGYGFGSYHGQYGFIVLSKYPLDLSRLRSFQTFLWKDMPNAALPKKADGSSWYTEQALKHFRLSSKNHIDLPVQVSKNKTIHLLAMHPTPPVFDGLEDRNGRRNHDEIRLFADYISTEPHKSSYLIDDKGNKSSLSAEDSFVIAGDLNADPIDGDSFKQSIIQLLHHPRINQDAAIGNKVPTSAGGQHYKTNKKYHGNAAYWTQLFPLRLDYVLPSSDLSVIDSGVYWQAKGDPQGYLFENSRGEQGKAVSSDHRLVWVDVTW